MKTRQDKIFKAVILNDTSKNNHYGCAVVMSQLRKKLSEKGVYISESIPIRESWTQEIYLRAIASSDLVIVNGEGTVHSSRDYAKDLISVAEHCHKLRIPCFFLNGVYQNNNNDFLRFMKFFTKIYVRESLSQTALASGGVSSKIVPDLVLSFTPKGQFSYESMGKSDLIIFTDSVKGAITKNLQDNYLHLNESVFITLAKDLKHKDFYSNIMSKKYIGRFFWKKYNGLKVYNFWRKGFLGDIDSLFNIVSSAKFVVTGRFHMVCFCILTGTPFAAIPSNTFKIEGILNDAGLNDCLIQNSEFSILDIDSKVASFDVNKSKNFREKACEDIDNMFTEIVNYVKAI